MVSTAAMWNDDRFESRVDKLEKALLSAIKGNRLQAPPVEANTVTDRMDLYPNTTGPWNSNRSWNPGIQEDTPRRELHDPYLPTPYPNTTYVLSYQRGNQNYQKYSGPGHNQHHYPNQLGNYPPSYKNQSDHTYHPYPNTQYNPHHSQNPNGFLSPNQHEGSIEENIGELLASQQSMRSCLQSNNEVAWGVWSAHKEHKANMDEMIKQVSQLADSINEIKGNLGKHQLAKRVPDRARVSEVTWRLESSFKKPELGTSPEDSSEVRNAEDALAERSCPDEIKLIITPQSNNALEEGSSETTEEPDEGMKMEKLSAYRSVKKRKKEGTVDSLFDAIVLPFGKNKKKYTIGRAKEKMVIKVNTVAMVQEKLSYKRSEPGWYDLMNNETHIIQKIEEDIKEVLTTVTIMKQKRWPGLTKSKDPSNHSLRPMEKRKIKGIFKNHKKRGVTTLMMYQRRNSWKEETGKEEVIPDTLSKEHLYCAAAPPKPISLAGNLDPRDPAESGEEERKLQLHEPEIQEKTEADGKRA